MNTILTLDHSIYFILGAAFEYGIGWGLLRLLKLHPNKSIEQDIEAKIIKIIDEKFSATNTNVPE